MGCVLKLRRKRSLILLTLVLFAFLGTVTEYNMLKKGLREGATLWARRFEAPDLNKLDLRPINMTIVGNNLTTSPLVLCRTDRWKDCSQLCHETDRFAVNFAFTPAGTFDINIHDEKDDMFVSGSIISQFIWEPDVSSLIWSQLRKFPDAVLVDVGSHVGQFALSAAKMGHKSIAIDPVINNVQRICRSMTMNNFTDKVTVIYGAVSDHRGTVAMEIPFKNIGGATIAGEGTIPSFFLDDLLPFAQRQDVIMKIDVEAHEEHVLMKGGNFFANNNVKVVAMEWISHRHAGNASRNIMEFFHKNDMVAMNVRMTKKLNESRYETWKDNVAWVKRELLSNIKQ